MGGERGEILTRLNFSIYSFINLSNLSEKRLKFEVGDESTGLREFWPS
jgi:hypothetical protein